MQDIKIMRDCYVPKENVKLYLTYNTNAIKERIRRMKKEDLVFDLTGGKKILSVIFLTSGEAILLNVSADTLRARMNTPVEKEAKG